MNELVTRSQPEQLKPLQEISKTSATGQRSAVPSLQIAPTTVGKGNRIWNHLSIMWNRFRKRRLEAEDRYEPGAWDVRSAVPRLTALAGMFRELATTGEIRDTFMGPSGWWRRNIRFLHGSVPGEPEDPRDKVRKAFLPLFSPRTGSARTPCPMVLITGATGTLGQAFARVCYLRGLPYRLLSRAEMDIADAASVASALHAFRPWCVVNAAGYVRVHDAEQEHERCFRENAHGPEVLARACAQQNIALATFSSDLVFDGTKSGPYIESDLPAPLNVYGRSKVDAEKRVAGSHPGTLIVRTSAFFGPWDEHNFVTQALRKFRVGEPVIAADDAFVSPTYIPDLANAVLDLLIDAEAGVWHLANANAVSWAQFARAAAQLENQDEGLVQGCRLADLKRSAREPLNSALTSERVQLLSSWENALDRYVWTLSKQPQWSDAEISPNRWTVN